MAGEFAVLPTSSFNQFCEGSLDKADSCFKELLAKHMVMELGDSTALELLNVKVQKPIRLLF